MGEYVDVYSTNLAVRKIREVLSDFYTQGYSRARPFTIGRVERRMEKFANDNNIILGSKHLYMSTRSISHALRDEKIEDGLAVPSIEIANFPLNRRNMDLFWDGEVFVYTDYNYKYIVHPNKEIKISKREKRKVLFITAGEVTNPLEFLNSGRYTMVT